MRSFDIKGYKTFLKSYAQETRLPTTTNVIIILFIILVEGGNGVRIIVTAEELAQAVQKLQPAVTERKMAHLALRAQKSSDDPSQGTLNFFASDSHLDLYCEVSCSLQGEGECFVTARLFSEIIRELPSGEVGLSVEGSFLVIRTYGSTQFEMKLPCLYDLMWLPKPEVAESTEVRLKSAQVSYMISQVASCLALESSHSYSEVGYLHQPSEGVLRLVATDAIRLSYCDIMCDLPAGFLNPGLCLSRKTLMLLLRVCELGYPHISLSVASHRTVCRVQVPGYDVYLRISHASYPEYRALIPKQQKYSLDLDREMLWGMAKRVMLAVDKSAGAKTTYSVGLSFTHNNLTVSAGTSGGSFGKETLAVELETEESLNFNVGGDHLLGILGSLSSTEVCLSMTHNQFPLLIYGKSEPGDCGSRHVLAPMSERSHEDS